MVNVFPTFFTNPRKRKDYLRFYKPPIITRGLKPLVSTKFLKQRFTYDLKISNNH